MQLHGDVSDEDLRKTIEMFQGVIYQRPPVRSSVKRSLRKKKVYEIEFLERMGRLVLLRIRSEAGTYMRKICHDIGELLGVGAHMRELRRTKTGPFSEENNLVKLQGVSEALYVFREYGKDKLLRRIILPMEYSVCEMPKIVIRDSAVEALTHGAQLAVPGILRFTSDVERRKRVAILTLKGELVAFGQALMSAKEIMENEKGIAVKLSRVIMPTGIYPRMWKKSKE